MEDVLLKIQDKEYQAHCDSEDYNNIIINGKTYNVDLLKKVHDNVFSFSVNQKLIQVEMDLEKNGKSLELTVDGLSYQVDISDSTKKLLDKYIRNSGMAGAGEETEIKAPMPGMVVKVLAKEGMEVIEGDKLVIVEAMKMENVLKAPAKGKIDKIKVKEGETVDKNQVLLEMEKK